jgi:hypothetical protein
VVLPNGTPENVMENYELGDLPEALRAWAKFRPADILDFKRRSKNLSLVLELPLQKTQDAFALACGYSGRHEIQQVLAQPGTPGPYDDDIPDEILNDIHQAQAIIQFYRHKRLLSAVDALIEGIPQRYFDNKDATACDLDLFSTPSRHRASAKAMTEFLGGEGSGCTFDGFPYGYRGHMHYHYFGLEATQFDEEALQELIAGWTVENPNEERLFDPREQARAQLRFRAPSLFAAMADRTAAPFVVEPYELNLDSFDWFERDSDITRLLLDDVDFAIAYQLSDVDADEDGELDRLQAALRSPTQDNVNASSVASSIANFADQIPRWRLSLRYQQAKQLRNPYHFFEGYEAECTLILDSHLRDGGFGSEPVPEGPLRWLSVCMERHDVELSQVHWKMTATLLLQESKETPWKAVALLTGNHIIAAKNGHYSGPDEVEMYGDDYGNSQLSEAWKLLAKLYVPVAGYLSYHEWVNNDWDGGGVVSILDPWVLPAHRGSDVSRWLLEGYARAFDDGTGYCRDASWQEHLDPRFDDMGEMTDDSETSIMGPGVMFIPLPGSRMLGYSVWEADRDEPTAKVLRFNGQRVGLRSRWGKSEPIKGGVGPRLLEVTKSIEADFVLYDPDDLGDENEQP